MEITTKITSGNAVNTYVYDELNQLIRETKDLRSVTKGNTTYLYRYNKDGIRKQKYLETGEVFLYQLDGSLIVGEQKLNNAGNIEYELELCCDSDDNILSVVYNGGGGM